MKAAVFEERCALSARLAIVRSEGDDLVQVPVRPENRMRTIKAAYRHVVRNDAAERFRRKPAMEVEGWWLDHEGRRERKAPAPLVAHGGHIGSTS